jgi:NTE family protein
LIPDSWFFLQASIDYKFKDFTPDLLTSVSQSENTESVALFLKDMKPATDGNKAGEKKYKSGFALSGGAYRSLGQAGAFKALFERGVRPDILCGTSTGAIINVLYATGYTPDDIYEIWEREPLGQVLELRLPDTGFLQPGKIGEMIGPYLRHERLEDLPIPNLITCTCMNDGTQKVFKEGNLVKILEATCAVQVFFEPVWIDGKQYCDGGLMSNLPAQPLQGLCDHIIGIYANPLREVERVEGLAHMIYRTIWIGLNSTVQKSRQFCDWFIAPEGLNDAELIDRSAMKHFYEEGYTFTNRFLDEHEISRKAI